MARLETQINQIYLTHPEKKNSLILYEEQLNASLHLFMVAELYNIQKKSESGDLKKISEIILTSFRNNKKLPAETLFESSLSTINQNLADLAHEGRKSWVGKFSCLICIKGLDNNIFVANNGQTSAWLKRRSNELMEILPAEKRGTHPLKTFMNYTQGKLTDGDSLILTTSNLFNYISFELFSKLLEQNSLSKVSEEVTSILRDSVSDDADFSAFLLHFTKKPLEETISFPSGAAIYAPLPEEIEAQAEIKLRRWNFKWPKLPSLKFKLPSINFGPLNKFKLPYFQNLSRAGKFFFISFTIFLLLFLVNLGFYAARINDKKAEKRSEELAGQISEHLSKTQSALIYKDENEAIEQLNLAIAGLDELMKLSPAKAEELSPKVEQVKTVINKINTVRDPKVDIELTDHPIYLSTSPSGLLFANQNYNSIYLFKDNTLNGYFTLNSLKDPISSIAFFSPIGVVVSTQDVLYKIDENLKEFVAVSNLNSGIKQLRTANNALYVLGNTDIAKLTYRNGSVQKQSSISGNFADVRDFGVDKDFYLLYSDKIIKYVSGQAQAFPLPNMSEPLTNGSKIFIGSNIYILENNKKRLIVLNKNGALINQIYFPTAGNLTDLYIDEASRSMYLLDDNKLYKVTF